MPFRIVFELLLSRRAVVGEGDEKDPRRERRKRKGGLLSSQGLRKPTTTRRINNK
jgi:hypothetical protein